MSNKECDVIIDLSNAPGVSGFEDGVVEVVKKHYDDTFDIDVDKMKNMTITYPKQKKKSLSILLDAHSDEVGFMVQFLFPNGTFGILPIGGWDPISLPGTSLRVRNSEGEWIQAIVASVPKHFKSQVDKKELQVSDIRVDVGATSLKELQEVYKIEVGAPIVPDVTCVEKDNGEFIGKAFDCRIGCAAMLQTMVELQDESYDAEVIGTLSAQEEIGHRGMQVLMNNLHPSIAICFEGCPADDTFLEGTYVQTALRKGPMLRHVDVSMITHPKFQAYALDLAKKHNIPVQTAVRSGGGTNGATIHLCDRGIPTIVVGIPVRYAHSHYGITTYEDYRSAIELAKVIVKEFNEDVYATF